MKILFYLLAAVFGLFGILAVLRTIEALDLGVGLWPNLLLIAVVALLLAVVCLKKARGGAREKK